MTDAVRAIPQAADAWLDPEQAAALLGLSIPRLLQAIDDGDLATRAAPSGRAGLMKNELLSWHRHVQAERREALVAFAAGIDREVFG